MIAEQALAEPRWHPASQSVPGPAGKVPRDWESQLNLRGWNRVCHCANCRARPAALGCGIDAAGSLRPFPAGRTTEVAALMETFKSP